MLAQGPQAVEHTEPPEHRLQRQRHAGAVCVIVELLYHDEFQEDQGQGLAVVHLQTEKGPGVLVCAGGRCHYSYTAGSRLRRNYTELKTE